MINPIEIAVLPIGEFDSDPTRHEYESIIDVFTQLDAILLIAAPVTDAEEARQSVQKLSVKNPDLLLLIPLRGLSAQVMEAAGRMSRALCLIWPVQGNFALPSSTLAVGALREAGVPVELHYAPPDHPASIERIQCVMKAARAYSRIRRSRIGVIGGLFPNLVSCRYDPQTVESRLGITILPLSFERLRDSIQSTSSHNHEFERSRHEIVNASAGITADVNAIDAGIRLHLALKQLAQSHKLDGFATECWSGFPRELGLNPCMGYVEDAYTLACEGDVMLCISLLMVKYLTGRSAYNGDLYDLDLDGILTMVHCGAPASLASNLQEVILAQSQLAMERGFETMTCRPRLEPGPVTLVRFYGLDCDKMHVVKGELLSCEQSPNLMVKVRIDGNRRDFLEQCFGNHYVLAAGDIRNELNLICHWLGITQFET